MVYPNPNDAPAPVYRSVCASAWREAEIILDAAKNASSISTAHLVGTHDPRRRIMRLVAARRGYVLDLDYV